jgi:hypothetical protein
LENKLVFFFRITCFILQAFCNVGPADGLLW